MKKKVLMTGLLLVLVMAVTMVFTGCGPANLQEFVEADAELSAEINGIAEGAGMEIEIVENSLFFTATDENEYDADMMDIVKDEYEKAMSAEDATFEAVVDDIEESTGFDVVLEVIVEDKDGGEIYSKAYN